MGMCIVLVNSGVAKAGPGWACARLKFVPLLHVTGSRAKRVRELALAQWLRVGSCDN